MASNTFTRMGHIARFAAAVTVLMLLAGDAAADLRSGADKLLRGDYDAAATDLANVRGKDRPRAQALLASLHLQRGEYKKAEALARKLARTRDKNRAADGAALLARALRAQGKYADAEKALAKATAGAPDHLEAQWQHGLVLRELGRRADAEKVWRTSFIEPYDAQKYDLKDPAKLFYLAEASRWFGEYELANDAYREALHIDPKLVEANVEWGHLFLSKYAAGNAEQSFDEVLKLNPRHPDAHAGMALVKLEQSYDLKAAGHHIAEALKVNPTHVPALLTRASLEIDQNKWSAARASVAEALAVNPMSFQAHALQATIHWLRDDTAAYDTTRKKVFAANPEYAEFFHIVARSAVREHRYKEAIELEKEAVKIDPKYYEAMQAIGTGYLRLGQEKAGLEWLKKAWKGDEYNVRTYNTLELFEKFIPSKYTFVASKYFKFRYDKDERAMLHRYVAPTLERAHADMVARYKFTPTKPIAIELFSDTQHYSVRTVGLPNLGALGVCFGRVITAMSPSVGNINWGMVLWHELAHVFAIQISKSRVPRWYTEGLSEYETLIARPEWRRENDVDVWQAMQEGRLPSVAELNYGFMKPNMHDIVVAYHLSSVTIEYIARTYGFDKVVEGLHLFGKGLETPEVIEKITGLKVPEFDRQFRAYLEVRLKAYKGTWRPPTTGMDDLKKLEIAVAANPGSDDAHARLAMGRFFEGNAPAAMAAAKKALELNKRNKIALYVTAEVELRLRKIDEAKAHFKELIDAGGDGFDVRGKLGMIARHQNDVAEAEKQLCAAKTLDPERSYPYMELSQIYESAGRTDDALRELESYVMLEQMQYGPVMKLVKGYKLKGNWSKVRTYAEMALQINPFDGDLHLDLGTAYVETGHIDKGIFELQSALMSKPELRRPALAHIVLARAWLAKKDKRRARAALKKALATEPANAEALALKKKL